MTGHVSTPAAGPVAGVDLLTAGLPAADHLLRQLAEMLGGALKPTTATHWARVGEQRHVALSVELPGLDEAGAVRLLLAALPAGVPAALSCGQVRCGPAPLQQAAAAAAAAHSTRTGGRAVTFAGSGALVGSRTVRQILDSSAIDRVRVLTAGDADPAAEVVTRDFVRPTWSAGELVLVVQPAAGGTLRPFEVPDPTPCCAGHG